jgi:hypothetical protein
MLDPAHVMTAFWKTYQGADNQHGARLVVVLSAGDDIPFLAVSAIAAADLNGGEVCAGISR